MTGALLKKVSGSMPTEVRIPCFSFATAFLSDILQIQNLL
jgi:hypothetical protein